jgi:hypothetical protein
VSGQKRCFLAEALNVPASYFLDEISTSAPSGFSEPASEPFQYEVDMQKTELNLAFSKLPNAAMRKAVVDFIKVISNNTK